MIKISLSRGDAAELYKRLYNAKLLAELTRDEMAANLPDSIYPRKSEKIREEIAHIGRVMQAILDAQKNAERSTEK